MSPPSAPPAEYREDWNTSALRSNRLYLGESAALPIPNAGAVILGSVLWPAAKIPVEGTWRPCLLGEVRCGNDDTSPADTRTRLLEDRAMTGSCQQWPKSSNATAGSVVLG
jgi:hypothetical protein